MIISRAILVLCCCLLTLNSHAGELLTHYLQEKDDHYILQLDMRINGYIDDVYAILTDYNNIHAINQSVIESRLIMSDGDRHTVSVISEGCVWIFCERVQQLQHVTELGRGYIMTITDPEHSDMKYGHVLWHIEDEGDTTRVRYNADFVPGPWLPPLVGSSVFKEQLFKQGVATINGIEELLQEP